MLQHPPNHRGAGRLSGHEFLAEDPLTTAATSIFKALEHSIQCTPQMARGRPDAQAQQRHFAATGCPDRDIPPTCDWWSRVGALNRSHQEDDPAFR